jgi:hypothetical protein
MACSGTALPFKEGNVYVIKSTAVTSPMFNNTRFEFSSEHAFTHVCLRFSLLPYHTYTYRLVATGRFNIQGELRFFGIMNTNRLFIYKKIFEVYVILTGRECYYVIEFIAVFYIMASLK